MEQTNLKTHTPLSSSFPACTQRALSNTIWTALGIHLLLTSFRIRRKQFLSIFIVLYVKAYLCPPKWSKSVGLLSLQFSVTFSQQYPCSGRTPSSNSIDHSSNWKLFRWASLSPTNCSMRNYYGTFRSDSRLPLDGEINNYRVCGCRRGSLGSSRPPLCTDILVTWQATSPHLGDCGCSYGK